MKQVTIYDSCYLYPGDRDLAERLLFEHGLDPDFRIHINPELVEVMAGTGKLEAYRGWCAYCGLPPNEGCDGGLH